MALKWNEMMLTALKESVVLLAHLEECEALPILLEESVALLARLKEVGLHPQIETLPVRLRETVVESAHLGESVAL